MTAVLEHVCKVIGADSYGNEAVICSDLLGINDGTFYSVEARTEAFCLDVGGDYVQCSDIQVANETAYATASGTTVSNKLDGFCGHQYGNCPATRLYDDGAIYSTPIPGCFANAWAVTTTVDNLGTKTAIRLPTSGDVFTLTANYATPHASYGNC